MNPTPTAPRTPRRRSRLKLMLMSSLAACAMLAPLLTPTAPSATAATPLPNGMTSRTAAGSCWEVKQNYPNSSDGSYWILTPALKAPQQFYCDMTTAGGGWVLVARGREGWKGWYQGVRPGTVRTVVDGPSAFAPAQLPAATVDALMNGGNVSALPDGIRLRRALDSTGSQRQEVRLTMPKRDRWVWTFRAEHPVGTYSFNSVAGSGGITNNFGADSAYRRVDTNWPAAQGYLGGFAYGAQVAGSSSSTSYLWSRTNGAGGARPFTQMFIRPQLTLAAMTFPAIANSGAAADTRSPLPDSNALRTVWGVTGNANGVDTELNTEVAAFGQVGSTVFVGGNFRYAQRTLAATGANKVEQPYLAAFNVTTGELISTFRPRLNGQVKAIVGLPDGRVAVGGQFSQANGAAAPGMVVLNATTGATASGWQVRVENRLAGGLAQVRGFSLQGNYLYLSGSFTHLTRAGQPTASAWNGARINIATGLPDTNWNPRINGTSVGVDAAESGDRTYFSGYFRQSGAVQTLSGTAIQTGAGAAVVQPVWQPRFSKSGVDASGQVTGNIWQFGVAESRGNVYLGGSEHSLFGYNRNTFARMSGHITKGGGDFQAVYQAGGLVFGGCHCGDFTYSNAFSWADVGTNWTQADNISLMGAWDAATGAAKYEFSPITQARRGFGSWAIFVDSAGNLWTGGDYSYSIRAGEVNQWSGGFVRFAPRDATAPSTPGGFVQSTSGSTATLSWGAATDTGGAVRYELIRDNKVIETTTARQLGVPVEESPVRYFVRAVDTAGNRSASSPVLVVQTGVTSTPPVAPTVTGAALDAAAVRLAWNSVATATEYRVSRNGSPVGVVAAPAATFTDTGLTAATTYAYSVTAVNGSGQQSAPGTTSVTTGPAGSTAVQLVAALSSWRWRFDSAPWPAAWRERTFDDSAWRTGPAVLGWNTAGMGTDISIGAQTPRPLSAQFRQSFTVSDPAAITTAQISVIANDGVVVYVNGTEVGRANLPTGTLTQNSYATAAPRSTTAAATRVTIDVPVALLVAGTNVIAASSHSNWRATPDMSFDLSLSGTR